MADITYASLTATGSAGATDLIAIWPSGGPLKVIQYSVLTTSVATALGSTFLTVANNLSDVASVTSARSNLGLAGAALLNVGTAAGTVAAGDDARITGAALKANNLSDMASASTARTNLGLGTAAVINTGTSGGTIGLLNTANTHSATQAFAAITATTGTFSGAVSGTSFTGAVTGNVTGNADTATKWATGRTMALTGNVTGTSAAYDGSGNTSFATTIAAGAVTLAMHANLAANSIMGNNTGSPAAPAALTATQVRTFIGTSPARSFANLKLTSAGSVLTVTVTADYVTMIDGSGGGYAASSLSATLDLSVNGLVNRLDTGTVAANTNYYVFAISNGSTTGALASLSATAPTLPSGYTFSSRLGWVWVDGTTKIRAFIQYGRKGQWINTAGSPQLMASGAAGSHTVPTWVALSTASYVPPTAATIRLNATGINTYVGVAPSNAYGAYNSLSNGPPFLMGGAGTSNPNGSVIELVLESTNVYWYNNGANAAIYSLGWEDNL